MPKYVVRYPAKISCNIAFTVQAETVEEAIGITRAQFKKGEKTRSFQFDNTVQWALDPIYLEAVHPEPFILEKVRENAA